MISSALIDTAIGAAANLLGIQLFRDSISGEDFDFAVRLNSFASPKGFSIRIADDYMGWNAHTVFDDLSLPLIKFMGARSFLKSNELIAAVEIVRNKSQSCEVLVNRMDVQGLASAAEWNDYESKIFVSFNEGDRQDRLVDVLIYSLSIPLILLQDDPDPSEEPDIYRSPRQEGAKTTVLQNKYERSRFNRALCLKEHGFTCKACGDSLANKYGAVAQELIHVHHLNPVSKLGGTTTVDPINDLVPLCPNCHNVIHRVDPPMSLDELKRLISH